MGPARVTSNPKVRDDLAVVELDGEAVVFDEQSCDLHYLNPTATLVFGLCDGSGTIDELAADIAAAYGADEEQVRRDVSAVVEDFGRSGLLTDRSG